MKIKNKRAFTMVELIVVVTILTILGAIGFISYQGQIESSRNTSRQTDILNLGVELKNHKLKNGIYPNPGDYFNIMYNGTGNIVAKQGFMNSKVYSTEIITAPLDPNYKIPYLYSVTKNNQFYELATIIEPIEDTEKTKTYLVGDYQTVAKDILPTILLATSTGTNNNVEISSGTTAGNLNRLTFLANNSSLNLAYGNNLTTPISTRTSFDSIFSESGVIYSQYPGYSSCQEIYDAGRSVGSGTYQILDTNGVVTNTGCSMVFGVQAYVGGAIYTKGQSFSFDGLTWYVSANTKIAYTKDSGTNDLPINLTDSDNIFVFDNGQTLIKGTNAFIIRTLNQGATQLYNYGISYTSGRLWNEGSITNYGADSTTRKASYTADKSMLGDYFQWGRNTPVSLTGTTTSLYNTTGYLTGGVNLSTDYGFVTTLISTGSWLGTYHNSSSGIVWTNSGIGNNGPCPSNYHVPTTITIGSGEWKKVIELVTGLTSAWTSTERGNLQKYLLLPMAGYRNYYAGDFDEQGSYGRYWASSTNGDNTYYLNFYSTGLSPISSNNRAYGFSVRCFKN
ncbi:MAG: FISUMP domain-containing protein [Candidatus Gracilibacteria bacterium]|nr:FISUMP domain-containing protein [Candidatus Gracilibacteria bacterium]